MYLPLVVLVAALAGSQPSSSAPAQKCKDVKGTFSAKLVKPPQCPPNGLCTAGELSGGLKGTYEFHIAKPPVPAGDPASPTIAFFVGQSTVTLKKNGDVLVGIDTGTIDQAPDRGGFASLITWTEGRGTLKGASGQIRLRGRLDAAAGTTSGDYQGTVCSARD